MNLPFDSFAVECSRVGNNNITLSCKIACERLADFDG
ncbi:hypothetical protein POPTR_008G057666v4 [Populus trichocarpa]|uniref:Uncharacterized protein n=1 Tax=Populus trichocarpa TaxID=3694 RepID=A0ACC0SK23_POPTR|nr:hypothetical protein BDE02_08G051500 [Populus trichocarpa]KAI9389533.1 hypothetical protein POPTR_008G057666v4 [Populus trichocarpa]